MPCERRARRCRRASRGDRCIRPGFPDRHPEHVAEDLRIGAAQPKHPEGGRRQWEAMQGFDSFERLPALRRADTRVARDGGPGRLARERETARRADPRRRAGAARGSRAPLPLGASRARPTPPCWTSSGGTRMPDAPEDVVRSGGGARRAHVPPATSRPRTRSATGSPRRGGPWSTNPAAIAWRSSPRGRNPSSVDARARCHPSWAMSPTWTRPSTGSARAGPKTSSGRSRVSAPTKEVAPCTTSWPTSPIGSPRRGATGSRSSGSRKARGGEPLGTPASSAHGGARY